MVLDKIKEIVKHECGEDDYNYHVIPTVNYAKILAKKIGADKEIVELAALLHDIGVKDHDDIHEIVGADKADKILRDLRYSDDVIESVKECIMTHRTSGEPKNKEAEIIRNADAMTHVAQLPFLVNIGLRRTDNLNGAIDWVKKKLDKVDKKLTMPEAKELIKEKYDAVRLILR